MNRDSVEKIKKGATSTAPPEKNSKKGHKMIGGKVVFLEREGKLMYLTLFYEKLNELGQVGKELN